jgi:cytidylate kinase
MLRDRDNSDKDRIISPLKAADDAIIIDSSNLKPDTVLDKILELYKISEACNK